MNPSNPPSGPSEQLTFFQFLLLVLSIVLLIALAVDTMAPVNEEISAILQALDGIVCTVFALDFLLRFRTARDKRAFMKWGWIDLVASIPAIDILRYGRVMRILQIIRILRGARLAQRLAAVFLENKPKSAAASVFLSTLLLITISSIWIVLVESPLPESNIKTAQDAVWWSVSTITTVGYGDKYPVSTEGRMLAMILMVCGVGLFGALSGLLATVLIGSRKQEEAQLQEILQRLDALDRHLGRGVKS